MRFLVDECCSRAIAEALVAAGHDVAYVPDVSPSGADLDLAVLARAEGRIVVTEDYDFGELSVRRGLANVGVVLIAGRWMSLRRRALRLAEVVRDHGDDLIGKLTVIETRRIRQRALT